MSCRGGAGTKVIIDHREMRSKVAEALCKLGADIEFATLEVGDYVVSDRVAFERKTVDDLFATLLERRELFSQLADLARSYRLPVLIIEGEDPFFFSGRRMHPMAVQGFLNTIALMRIPTLYTLNEAETAQVIGMIADKEQGNRNKHFNQHGKRSRLSKSEAKEYTLSSIPGVGPRVAGNLLRHFGSVEKVMTAPGEELMKVERVGARIAERIREVAGGRYDHNPFVIGKRKTVKYPPLHTHISASSLTPILNDLEIRISSKVKWKARITFFPTLSFVN